MKNNIFIADDFTSAILDAEMHVGKRPGGKVINPYSKLRWEDASEEIRKDPNVNWYTRDSLMYGKEIYTFRKPTKEEKREIFLNNQWKIKEQFKYILKKYGWKIAEKFYIVKKNVFEEFEIEINFNIIPHCEYSKEKQCDLFCPYFKGNCKYEGDFNEDNL